MASLPYSRVVNVSLTRKDSFPTIAGFGTILVLTSKEIAGKLDATKRTRSYGSIDDVATDFDVADDFYKQALVAFAQNPRPLTLKAGFYDDTGIDETELAAELLAISAFDDDFYWVIIPAAMRDAVYLSALTSWIAARPKQAIIDTNLAALKTASTATGYVVSLKNLTERISTFYHSDATQYPAIALAAVLSSKNFDNPNTAYTAKFQKLLGVPAAELNSTEVQAVTGFTPGTGQAVTTGHLCNTLINIGGQIFVVEGSTMTPNLFIDQIHASDWIVARTNEAILAVYLNNDRIPFSDLGLDQIASGPKDVMEVAKRAGIVKREVNDLTGEYEQNIRINIPAISTLTDAQVASRVAPAITLQFKYAGAVHYSTIKFIMEF